MAVTEEFLLLAAGGTHNIFFPAGFLDISFKFTPQSGVGAWIFLVVCFF